ncbi:IclR family transcriptional regulator [Effusibacillus pohliae]|uniref:IclR family transcriptional regulator n=1 Tax=Effusibacillus pohliae TaxID=232270 RepID=UPI00035D8564|nr:IclR family transcriptional regulator [Effusibacillus pohliae]
MPSDEKDRYNSNSLVRGLDILRMFNAENPTLSLSEIANRLGVSRTTPFRLLYTLQTLGYLRQDEHTKRYELTPKVLELGFAYLSTLQLPEIARPYLERLRDETGASAHIGILDGREVVYVAREAARGVTTVNVTIGSRLPAHATAMGKVLLAFQSKERIKEILFGTELQPYTNYTKTMILELLQELETIRQQRYAMSNGEFESGIRSVAAPVFDRNGEVIAAVNVAAPESVLRDDFVSDTVLPAVREVAEKLSVFSGYRFSKSANQ